MSADRYDSLNRRTCSGLQSLTAAGLYRYLCRRTAAAAEIAAAALMWTQRTLYGVSTAHASHTTCLFVERWTTSRGKRRHVKEQEPATMLMTGAVAAIRSSAIAQQAKQRYVAVRVPQRQWYAMQWSSPAAEETSARSSVPLRRNHQRLP